MKRVLTAALLAFFASGSPAEAQGIRITVAPPAMRVEVRPAAPSVRHIWVPGFWRWGGGRHVWAAGHYEVPPAAGRVWVDARWANEGGQWVFYEGHWEPAGGAVVHQAPPPRVVVQPAPQPVVVHQAPRQVVVVQPAPAPVIVHDHDHDRGPGWHGKGKGWKGKGKGWKGKGKGHWK
jgi:hypothetical protein